MKRTGLFDKNNIEICEGHIIRETFNKGQTIQNGFSQISTVFYKDNEFITINKYNMTSKLKNLCSDEIEIIGSI